MSVQSFEKIKLNTVNRLPARATYDKPEIIAIAQEAKVAHLAWSDETTGLPQCVPMLAALEEIDGDLFVYFHGQSIHTPSPHLISSTSRPYRRPIPQVPQ